MGNDESGNYRGTDTYTTQDHHGFVKENFKVLGGLLESRLSEGVLTENCKVIDVGCATGALISYLKGRFPGFHFHGVDISDELIEIARQKVPEATFDVGSVFDLPDEGGEKFDVALLIGVLGVFDAAAANQALKKLISSVRQGGVIYIFSQFNEFDLDVMMKYRRVGSQDAWDGWGVGWNNYSYHTVGAWLEGNCQSHRFIDFTMPFPLEPKENPIRSWTVDMPDGTRRLTNGLKLLVDLRFLEISV